MIALAALGLACIVLLMGFVYYKETHLPPIGDSDVIIVLGAQVKEDGTPSVALERRLTAAHESYLADRQLIIVCGAQGGNEPAPEGDVMRDWLIARGVPAEQVISDPDSYNTRQNIRNAAQLLAGRDASRVLIVTSDYHLPRAMALAEDEGLSATGVGSPCKNDIVNWTRNHGRETLSWVKYLLVKYLHLPLE